MYGTTVLSKGYIQLKSQTNNYFKDRSLSCNSKGSSSVASCSGGGVLCSVDAELVDVLAVLRFSHVVRGRCALRAFGSSLDSLEFADERDFLTQLS